MLFEMALALCRCNLLHVLLIKLIFPAILSASVNAGNCAEQSGETNTIREPRSTNVSQSCCCCCFCLRFRHARVS